MKKVFKTLLLATAVIIVLLSAMFAVLAVKINETNKQVNSIEIENINLGYIKNGVYEGSCYTEMVTAEVTVTVESGSITELILNEHSHGPGRGADDIVNRIISEQSLYVDAVTGATQSSTVIRKAVENALKQGL